MRSLFHTILAGVFLGATIVLSVSMVTAGLGFPTINPGEKRSIDSPNGSVFSKYNKILTDTSASSNGTVKNTKRLEGQELSYYQRRVTSPCTSTNPIVSINADGTVTCRVKASWQPSGTWGACSVSCGGGTQIQPYVCMDASSNVLPDTDCSGAKPANLSRACNTNICVACTPDGSCDAIEPACGATTSGVDNCGSACTKTGVPCCTMRFECLYGSHISYDPISCPATKTQMSCDGSQSAWCDTVCRGFNSDPTCWDHIEVPLTNAVFGCY